VLVNFFYAPPVGHAIEALHYCLGHHVADPSREIAVVLNAATPTPSMSRERIDRDLPRIVAAAAELLAGSLSYEQALRDYFPALLAAHQGDLSQIWSIDGIHVSVLARPPGG
jgi:hypothetical protein